MDLQSPSISAMNSVTGGGGGAIFNFNGTLNHSAFANGTVGQLDGAWGTPGSTPTNAAAAAAAALAAGKVGAKKGSKSDAATKGKK